MAKKKEEEKSAPPPVRKGGPTKQRPHKRKLAGLCRPARGLCLAAGILYPDPDVSSATFIRRVVKRSAAMVAGYDRYEYDRLNP